MPTPNLKVPPHNLEAEQSLLGALLIDKEAFNKIADQVKPEDFYKNIHGIIYESMVELYSKHEPIDLLSLGNRLEEKKQLETIGGRSYLIGLANVVPSASNIEHYSQIIQKKATLRRLQTAANEIATISQQEDEEIENLLDDAERKIFEVSQKMIKKVFTPIDEILTGAFERIDELHREKGKIRGIPTGFTHIDSMLAGLQRSDLVILAARPSVGKTSFALDIARNMATKANAAVGFFSLEMSKEQLVDRLLCAEANVDLWKMRTGKLSERPENDDFGKIGKAIDTLSKAQIYIDDNAQANIMTVRTKARRLKSEKQLDVIIIDYLQLMEGRSKSDNRVQEIAEISRGLKAIARELNVPILALAQLARAVELSKPAIPKLSHLRDSGSIEQDADVVMFIYRKAADKNYRPDQLTEEEKRTAEIHIAKHRNGPTGVIKMAFQAEQASFRTLEQNMDDGYEAMGIAAGSGGTGGFDIFT